LVAHCSGITSIADSALPETSQIAEAVGIPHYHSSETSRRIASKVEQRRAFSQAGLPQPRWHEIDLDDPDWISRVPAAMDGPGLVAKPARGWGSTGVRFIPTLAQAPQIMHGESGLWLIEEEIIGEPHPVGDWLGDHVSVQTMSFEGEHWMMGVMDKPPHAPPFRATGDICPSVLPPGIVQQCEEAALGAIKALGIRNGWSHTELKLSPDGPKLLEVNGRMSGTADGASLRLYGSSPLRNWFRLALGHKPQVKRFEYGGAVVCQYLVQAPSRPVCPKDVKDIIPQLQGLPEVFDVRALWLDHLDGNAAPITLNSVMTIWLDAKDATELCMTMDEINRMLRSIGLCEWSESYHYIAHPESD
jgi:biotin carboxylase